MSFFAFETPAESPVVFLFHLSLSKKVERRRARVCFLCVIGYIARVSRCMSLGVSRGRARVLLPFSVDFAGLVYVFTAAAVCVARVCPVPLRLAALPVPLIHSK